MGDPLCLTNGEDRYGEPLASGARTITFKLCPAATGATLLVDYCAQTPGGAGRFYRRFGWDVLAATKKGWRLGAS